MDKEEFDRRKTMFVYCYFIEKFCEENKSRFIGIYIYEIYPMILNDTNLVIKLTEFLSQKMYEITYDPNEAMKLKEIFISELN